MAGYAAASGGADFALARYHAITFCEVVVTRIGTAGDDTIVGAGSPDLQSLALGAMTQLQPRRQRYSLWRLQQ